MAEEAGKSEQHSFAWRAAIQIGAPTIVMTFIVVDSDRFRTFGRFFSLQTLIDIVIGVVVGLTLGYVGGLLLWRLKRKLENT